MSAAAGVSIFNAIGGEPALVAVVDDFYVRVLADPQLAGRETIARTAAAVIPLGSAIVSRGPS